MFADSCNQVVSSGSLDLSEFRNPPVCAGRGQGAYLETRVSLEMALSSWEDRIFCSVYVWKCNKCQMGGAQCRYDRC